MRMKRLCLRFAVVGLLISLALGPSAAAARAAEDKQAAPQSGHRVWRDATGNPLPFKNDEELLEFLRTANVVSDKPIPTGVTAPHKVTLEENGIQMNAVFRTVDEEKTNFVSDTGTREMLFRDSYIYEPAAYEVSRLLGLDNVPPAIVRKLHGRTGSVQVWVEKAMTEGARRDKKVAPPDQQRWNKQMQTIVVFDALVANTDRNPGNILITPDWEAWMIDHTRAFRLNHSLANEKLVKQCDRSMYERMKALDERVVQQRLKDYLRPPEIKALLKRREQIVKRLDRLIAEQGEKAVLFTLAPPAAGE